MMMHISLYAVLNINKYLSIIKNKWIIIEESDNLYIIIIIIILTKNTVRRKWNNQNETILLKTYKNHI